MKRTYTLTQDIKNKSDKLKIDIIDKLDTIIYNIKELYELSYINVSFDCLDFRFKNNDSILYSFSIKENNSLFIYKNGVIINHIYLFLPTSNKLTFFNLQNNEFEEVIRELAYLLSQIDQDLLMFYFKNKKEN